MPSNDKCAFDSGPGESCAIDTGADVITRTPVSKSNPAWSWRQSILGDYRSKLSAK